MTKADRVFRLAICQLAPRLGDVAANAEAIGRLVTSIPADLYLTPELSLTGYDLRDRVHDLAIADDDVGARAALPDGRAVVAGYVERGDDAVLYNAAVLLHGETAFFNQRKVYLPTYGMFDEGRYFGRGNRVRAFEWNGWRFGLLICEDFWHPSLAYLAACQRIDALLVIAAAPGRGVWAAGETGPFASADVWERIARTTAQLYGIYVGLCNRVGVEGGVTFAGGSLVAAPSGDVVDRAEGLDEQVFVSVLSRDELERARTPYAHIRDEDPALVLRELTRLLRP